MVYLFLLLLVVVFLYLFRDTLFNRNLFSEEERLTHYIGIPEDMDAEGYIREWMDKHKNLNKVNNKYPSYIRRVK